MTHAWNSSFHRRAMMHITISRAIARDMSSPNTGNNLPDLSVIVELADFYDVDLNEIFRGERRKETMDTELKDTMLQAAEYSEGIRKKIIKRMHLLFICGCIAFVFYLTVLFLEPEQTSELFDFIKGMSLGISFGMVVVGIIMTRQLTRLIIQQT